MQMLYNSDSYVVVRFDSPETGDGSARRGGGYEIVDKLARKEIFLEGEVAESFQRGVQALVDIGQDASVDADAMDDYLAGYTAFAQQPLILH